MMNEDENRKANPTGWFSALKWVGMRATDRANEKRVNSFAFAWIGLLTGANVLRHTTQLPEPVILAVALASAIPGALFVKAYLKMLREADEMLRQMQYEALAVGFGAGVVCGMTAMVLLPEGPIFGFATLMPMVIGFSARIIFAGRRIAQEFSVTDENDGEGE